MGGPNPTSEGGYEREPDKKGGMLFRKINSSNAFTEAVDIALLSGAQHFF
jgi:hypothetical protein